MNCLTNFINQNNLDFIGVQETKKATIENSYLEGASRQMEWNYVPAKGNAGGGGSWWALKAACLRL
jgi:hypothetical protein